jgi:molybdate transport system ATP-binding protein
MENGVMQIEVEKALFTANGPMDLQISVNLPIGELMVLFGDSGAGKTTILRMLAGLTKPDRGVIRMGDQVWFDSEANINLVPQRRSIGFMFQDYALFPNMSVLENIAFAQKERNINEACQLIDKFGLSEFTHRKPTKLSGGQKQRVALARALACEPEFLLLDEPLSALDAKTRVQLQDEILKAHQYCNTTTLLVSHDLAEVFRLAQKVIRIDHGKITALGKPDELFIDNQISGKVQISGTLVKIEKHDTFYLLTVVTGMNQLIKVTAFENDMENLHEGDQVMVFSKAFNPIVMKV